MWVKPRKLNVSGLPTPHCFRLAAAKRRFDQARLVWVQLQTELPQALPPMDHHDFPAIQPANKKFAAEYSEHTKIAVFA